MKVVKAALGLCLDPPLKFVPDCLADLIQRRSLERFAEDRVGRKDLATHAVGPEAMLDVAE